MNCRLLAQANILEPLRSIVTVFLVLLFSEISYAQYDYHALTKATFFGNMVNTHFGVCDVVVDAQGYVFVCGTADGIPTTPGAYKSVNSHFTSAFVCKFSPDLGSLVWSTYLGSTSPNGDETAHRMVLDNQGNVTLLVFVNSTGFPCSDPADSVYRNAWYICQLNASGSQLIFSRALSHVSRSFSSWFAYSTGHLGLIFNAQNEICVSVLTDSAAKITANAYQTNIVGQNDIVFSKLSSSGSLLYSTYIGGSGQESFCDIVSANNKLFLYGTTNSTNFPLASGKTPDSQGDCFVMSWQDGATPTPIGTYVFGGSDVDRSHQLIYSSMTNKLIAIGFTSSTNIPYTKLLQSGQVSGGFVCSLNTDLSGINYLTMLGSNVKPTSIKPRLNGDVYISTFNTSPSSMPVSPHAYRGSMSMQYGPYSNGVIGLDGSGSLRYGTYINETDNGGFMHLAIKEQGCKFSTYLATVAERNFPVTPSVYQSVYSTGGVCILQSAHPDSAVFSSTSVCGEFTFTGTSSGSTACPAINTRWNFGDGSGTQYGSPILHKYAKNGVYHVNMKVAYAGGDTSSFDTTITVNSQPTIKASPNPVYRCSGDNGLQLSASGGVRYEWHPGATLSDSNSAQPIAKPTQNRSKYYLRGYDAAGCFADDTVEVYVTTVVPMLFSTDSIICEGRSVKLKASGGSSYKWLNDPTLKSTKDSATATPVVTTTYRVVVMDGNCSDTARYTVQVAHKPQLTLSPAPIMCTGGSTELNATISSANSIDTMGVSYLWSPPTGLDNVKLKNPIAKPLKTTTYTCTITNTYGCVATASVEVKVLNALDLQLLPDTTVCRGSSTVLRASGGATYSWSPRTGLDDSSSATPRCNITQTTTYIVMTWSGNFSTATCRDTARVTITVADIPLVTAIGDTTVCPGETVSMRAIANDSLVSAYEWYDAAKQKLATGKSFSALAMATTRFFVKALNSYGCFAMDSVKVIVDSALVSVKAQASATTVKPGSNVKLSVQTPNTSVRYEWRKLSGTLLASTDTLRLNIMATDTFVVKATRSGCVSQDTVIVTVSNNAPLQVTASADTTICAGFPAQLRVLNSDSTVQYEWLDTTGTIIIAAGTGNVTPLETTRYVVHANDGRTDAYDTVQVRVSPRPLLRADDQFVCAGESAELGVANIDVSNSYAWFTETGILMSATAILRVNPIATTRYIVQAINSFGCSAYDTVVVSVSPAATVRMSLSITQPQAEIRAGDTILIHVSATSDQAVNADSLIFTLRVHGNALQIPGGDYSANDMLLRVAHAANLGTSSQEVFSVPAVILVNTDHSTTLRLGSIEIAPSSCIVIDSNSATIQIHTEQVCADLLHTIQLVGTPLSISPNPSSGQLRIQSFDPIEDLRIENTLGSTVYSILSDIISAPRREHDVDVHSLANGVYTVRVKTYDTWHIAQVIVIH